MKSPKKYKAFTLIEIIVSLLVVGIVMATLPVLMDVFKGGAKTNMTEEAFYSEFSLLNLIAGRYFDENNTLDDNYYKDLNATRGDTQLLIENWNKNLNRLGKEQINNNIYRSGSKYTTSVIGPDGGESSVDDYDDIDDFNGYIEHIYMLTSKGIDLKVNVYYISDETNYDDNVINFKFDFKTKKDQTNIKVIKIYTKVNGKEVVLYYPICNIGASKLLSLSDITGK